MKILCSYCLKRFEEKELTYDGEEKMDYCPICGEVYYAKLNNKQIMQKVLQAAYDKLYYDYRHVLITTRIEDDIFFNSEEYPCGENEVGTIDGNSEGIEIGIKVETDSEEEQSECGVSIYYYDANGERQVVFNDRFLPEDNFSAVMEKLRPELYKLTGDFNFLGFDLSTCDINTINACFSMEQQREEYRLFFTGFFPGAAQVIARKLGLSEHGSGYSTYYTNDEKRIIFTYTEGDLSIKIFNDDDMYHEEVEKTEKFYRET